MTTPQFLLSIWNWLMTDYTHPIAAAGFLCMLTPTPAPTSWLSKPYKALEFVAMNVLHAKETGTSATSIAEEVAAILAKPQAPVAPVVNPVIPHQ